MARIVIVSNRVPIPKARVAAAGGLAVALKDLLIPGSMWFGWSGRLSPEPSLQPAWVEARGTHKVIGTAAEARSAQAVTLHFQDGPVEARVERTAGKAYTATKPPEQPSLL